ncbi:MAG: hypothetical protein QG574_5642, partial [Cyanobacteriota bacterium erpe_2018_sw_21hr_WHONDRS-SW48-000092_B_bin.40]|nr:hypothetical protein [Cyanobacteriota bacterium erpe_2018_sw_21hr_WHONDRS-SW48-000092_B_bin.40]
MSGNNESPKALAAQAKKAAAAAEAASKLKTDRLKKLSALKEQGINPYPYKFER